MLSKTRFPCAQKSVQKPSFKSRHSKSRGPKGSGQVPTGFRLSGTRRPCPGPEASATTRLSVLALSFAPTKVRNAPIRSPDPLSPRRRQSRSPRRALSAQPSVAYWLEIYKGASAGLHCCSECARVCTERSVCCLPSLTKCRSCVWSAWLRLSQCLTSAAAAKLNSDGEFIAASDVTARCEIAIYRHVHHQKDHWTFRPHFRTHPNLPPLPLPSPISVSLGRHTDFPSPKVGIAKWTKWKKRAENAASSSLEAFVRRRM